MPYVVEGSLVQGVPFDRAAMPYRGPTRLILDYEAYGAWAGSACVEDFISWFNCQPDHNTSMLRRLLSLLV